MHRDEILKLWYCCASIRHMRDLSKNMLNFAIKETASGIGKYRSVEACTEHGMTKKFIFKTLKIIGRGSFGLVSKIGTSCGKTLAMKMVYEDNRYKNRELDILLAVDHPNIVRLKYYFYTGESPSGHYLNLCYDFMPIILEDFVKDKSIYVGLIKNLYTQALLALDYLHELGICHRDLKPANLLLDHNLNLKICDFGAAKYIQADRDNICYICSRYYRSPENLMNYPQYTTKIDIWSLAVVFCEFRLASPLFKGNTTDSMLDIIFAMVGRDIRAEMKYGYTAGQEHSKFDFHGYLYGLFEDRLLAEVIGSSLVIDFEKRKSASELLEMLPGECENPSV